MFRSVLIVIGILVSSCKSTKQSSSEPAIYAAAPTPMSCIVDGRIVEILKPVDTDMNSVCSKHPCMAKVLIEDIHTCGSSVSLPVNPGDTMEMHFTYTLSDTRKIFPDMKAHYPGLKKGKKFTATVEQRLAPGTDGHFVVTHYTVK